MQTILAFIAAVVLILVGAAGVFLPLLPGVPVAWLGFFIYALATRFEAISLSIAMVFLGATLFTVVFDFAAPIVGARRWNASRYGIIGATLGLFIGVPLLGPFGILLGPVAGAFLGEVIAGKTPERATKSAVGTLIGFFAGAILKFAVILGMAGFLIESLF